MDNYSDFEKWLNNQKNVNSVNILQLLKRANEIYNNKTTERIDFSKDSQTFLELNTNNHLVNEIKNDLDSLVQDKKLKASIQLRFDILVAMSLYYDYLTQNNDIADENSLTTDFYNDENRIEGAINKIYYGAPGTGKSFKVQKTYDDFERITLHPEYTYFDFVGGLRPVQNNSGSISYEFVPGPFTETLIKAVENKNEHYGLIIEEINRANTAAVFGDLFQLLDRDEVGKSRYEIKNKDLCDYIEKISNKSCKKIYIPSNMSLIATMNSADQGVYVMDSAFKRRWQFEYIPIQFDDDDLQDIEISGFNMKWKDFVKTLNSFLSKIDVDEDKLIGQRFINKDDLKDKKLVSSKLLIYLWDDVLRYNRAKLFKNDKSFSDLVEKYIEKNEGINIFVDDLKKKMEISQKSNIPNHRETGNIDDE